MRDSDRLVVEFHAIWHTFITRLSRSGATQSVAQTLARHSTMTLTMDRYTHVAVADSARALDALHPIPITSPDVPREAAQVAATGTHGQTEASSGARPASALEGLSAARDHVQEQRAQTTEGHPVSSPVVSAAERIGQASDCSHPNSPRRQTALA